MTDHERARKLRAIAADLELVAHGLETATAPIDAKRAAALRLKLAGSGGERELAAILRELAQ